MPTPLAFWSDDHNKEKKKAEESLQSHLIWCELVNT